MTAAPKVSVVMAVYDGAEYLEEALGSLFAQSFSDFDLIVVDDGSSDATPGLLSACADPRLRVIRNAENIGLTRSLNIGLEAARTPYIARLDADDRTHPERLARQVAFLDSRPDHVIVASGYREIDSDGRVLRRLDAPMPDLEVRWVSQIRTALAHSSVMFRRCAPDGAPYRYDARWRTAQDSALWHEMLLHGRAEVLGEALVDYRLHDRAVTSQRRAEQRETLRLIALEAAERRAAAHGDALSAADLADLGELLALCLFDEPFGRDRFTAALRGLDKLTDDFLAREPLSAREARFVRARGAGQFWTSVLAKRPGRRRPGIRDLAGLLWLGRRTAPHLALRLALRRCPTRAAPPAAS